MDLSKLKKISPRWVAALAIAIIGILTFHKYQLLDSPDYRVFYTAGKFAHSTPEKIYHESPDRFLYPPVAALLFSPFSIPELATSKLIWYGLSLLTLFLLAGSTWAELLAFLLLTRYFVINLRYGQINIMILLMMIFANRALLRNRIHQAGAWIALASMFKIFPAVQGASLLWKRNWRAIFAVIAGATALALVPFFIWGPSTALQLYQEFPGALADKGIPTNSHNQSILVLLMRFFYVQMFYAFPIDYVYWQIAALPLWLLKLIAISVGILLSASAWITSEKRNLPLDALSATMFSILYLSHIVWKPYFIFLLPPLIQCITRGPRSHYILLGSFLFWGPFLSSDIFGKYSVFAEGANIHLTASLLLFLAWIRLPAKQ